MNGLKLAALATVLGWSALSGQELSAQTYYSYPAVRPVNRYVVPVAPSNRYVAPNCKNGQCNVPVVPNCKDGTCNFNAAPICRDGKCYQPGYGPSPRYPYSNVPLAVPRQPGNAFPYAQPNRYEQPPQLGPAPAFRNPIGRPIDESIFYQPSSRTPVAPEAENFRLDNDHTDPVTTVPAPRRTIPQHRTNRPAGAPFYSSPSNIVPTSGYVRPNRRQVVPAYSAPMNPVNASPFYQ